LWLRDEGGGGNYEEKDGDESMSHSSPCRALSFKSDGATKNVMWRPGHYVVASSVATTRRLVKNSL
jgi:hypothetical protein